MEYRYPTVMKDGKVTDVIVPVEDYLRMEAAEAMAADTEPFIPIEVAHAVAVGTNPLRAWREYLHLTQEVLGERLGKKSRAYISQLEAKGRVPRIDTLQRLAKALHLDDENKLIKLYD